MNAYRSILPQRTRSIEPADFKAAPNLTVHANSFAQSDAALWDRAIPIFPQSLVSLHEQSFQRKLDIQAHFLRGNTKPEDCIVGLNIAPLENDDFFGSLKITQGAKIDPKASSFYVEPVAQGGGLGKAWLKCMVELGIALGNEDLRFEAGSDNGSFTWGKAGVPMDMAPEGADKRTILSRIVIGRLEAIRPFLSPGDYGKARALSRFVARDDINRLAAMDVVVPRSVLDDLQKNEPTICGRMAEFYALHPSVDDPKALTLKNKTHLMAAFESAGRQGRELSLPRLILSWTSWDAHIDFNHVQEMETIGAYLGGWKTIEPASRDNNPALQR